VRFEHRDYIDVVASESARLVAALEAGGARPIPWSDTWTVQDCAQHVGAVHRVVAKVLAGRPTTTFDAFAEVAIPDASDPVLSQWVAGSTSALLEELRSVPPDDPCWSWSSFGGTAAFWARRMAQETLVHRWDAELGAGVAMDPMDPALAADGVDEYLEIFVERVRSRTSAPGKGESVHVHCTDTDGEWLVTFPDAGVSVLRREHAKGDVAFRGPAEGLLLFLWGRVDAGGGGVEVIGDDDVRARWRELVPAI
jgi:uncharacterized protein (TIGR03083 family)